MPNILPRLSIARRIARHAARGTHTQIFGIGLIMHCFRDISLALAVIGLVVALPRARAADDGEHFFETKVRPLLEAKCLECHGENEPEAGLRLTSREHLLKGGDSGPAAREKQPAESLIIKAVLRKGPIKMPPDEPLTAAELDVLQQWVAQGLPWAKTVGVASNRKVFSISEADRRHWAFQPVAEMKSAGGFNKNEEISAMDGHIAAKQAAAGVKSAPEADRRTLVRRATYDLTGLPPTWAETEAFVKDPAPTAAAFEKLVERLLASPRYGERWGRHWLDVARFADSKDGVLMYGDDRVRPYAYTYRDYVIRAFNEDTPFDQFIREQLAADLITPKLPPWRMAAMGYLTLGRMYDNNVHDIIDDQIDTVSRGFLGLTVACARCHDHKYDPVSTADYYSLYGVFASTEAPAELPLTVAAVAPEAREFEKQAAAKRDEIRTFRDKQFELLSETARQRVGDYLERVATTRPDPLETAIFFLSLAPEDLRPPITARWRKYLDQHATPTDPVFGPWAELMDAMPLAEANSNASVNTTALPQQPNPADIEKILKKWQGKPSGMKPGQVNPLVVKALMEARPKNRAEVARAYGGAMKKAYDEMKSSAAVSSEIKEARLQLAQLLTSRESPVYFPKSQTRKYMSRAETDQFGGKVQELDRMAVKSPVAPPRAMALVDAETPYQPHIFTRGNPTAPGRAVPRQFLQVLATADSKPFTPSGSGRLELANRIASVDNPLTARVLVNRVWMHHFGEPLVASPSDFGKRTARPEHAALLDHLAARFVADGWSIKKLHRQIMLTRLYRQSSDAPAGQDPENRLLVRANRQRLSFEAMRDTLLAISGRLEHRTGGRPVDITDPQSRSRSVFGMVDRQSLPGVFRAFDFATPDQSVERRVRTMGPQQALFALNSDFMITQARALAARPELANATDSSERLVALYRLVYQRDPLADEMKLAAEFLGQPADGASKLSVWEQLAQVLLSSNELMYVD